MEEASVLTTLVLILGVALVVVALSQRLKVLSVVGFMLTGVLLGPSGIGLVKATTCGLVVKGSLMMTMLPPAGQSGRSISDWKPVTKA